MPEPHNDNDSAMDAPTGISAMGYNLKQKWINQWTSSLNKTVDQLGPVYSTAQVSSTKDETVDQLEEQPSRLHHTLLGLASRGLIRQDLLRRLWDLEGKQVSRDEAGCVRGSSSTSLSTTPSMVSAGLVEWSPPSSSSEGGGLAQFGLHASKSKRGYSQLDRLASSKLKSDGWRAGQFGLHAA